MKRFVFSSKTLGVLFLWMAFTLPGWAQPSPPILQQENQYTLPSGAVFKAPVDWDVKSSGGTFILQDPDRKITMVVSESNEMDGQDAIRMAWKSYDPDFSAAINQVRHQTKNDRWDEVYRQWYFVSSSNDPYKADETKGLYAVSRKKNGRWYVVLMSYDRAAEDKRRAQVDIILGSLKAAGSLTPTPTPHAARMDAASLKVFGDFVEQARRRCQIPGAAVAVVADGKVVYEKGFGVREKGKKDPVTTRTLFSIASITKPLTTLLMARLVDAGRMDWNTPVTQLLPGFRLADPRTTSELTLQYTVCSCAGLPRQDAELIFPTGYSSPEAVIDKMATMEPTTGFGETFQYSNLMVAAGGFAAAHAIYPQLPLGQAYAEAMQKFVFDPLGMTDTTLDFAGLPGKDFAAPHCHSSDLDYVPVPLGYNDWVVPVAPAAGIWSNVDDMAKYLLLELNKGVGPDGSRIVSAANLLKRRQPQVRINETDAYGLGLMIGDDKGITVVGHDGNSTGYTSDMAFLPDWDMGLVLFTNADQAWDFRSTVYEKWMELVSGRKPRAQAELDADLSRRHKEGQEWSNWAENQLSQSWLYDFVGNYFNPDLGSVTLKMTETGGFFDAGKWKSRIAGYAGRGGEAVFYLMGPPLTWAKFVLDDKDGRKTITYKTPQKDYVFEPVPQGR